MARLTARRPGSPQIGKPHLNTLDIRLQRSATCKIEDQRTFRTTGLCWLEGNGQKRQNRLRLAAIDTDAAQCLDLVDMEDSATALMPAEKQTPRLRLFPCETVEGYQQAPLFRCVVNVTDPRDSVLSMRGNDDQIFRVHRQQFQGVRHTKPRFAGFADTKKTVEPTGKRCASRTQAE